MGNTRGCLRVRGVGGNGTMGLECITRVWSNNSLSLSPSVCLVLCEGHLGSCLSVSITRVLSDSG